LHHSSSTFFEFQVKFAFIIPNTFFPLIIQYSPFQRSV